MDRDVTGLSWKNLDQDINGESVGDNSGWSVSLSADGKSEAIVPHTDDGNGDRSGQVSILSIELS